MAGSERFQVGRITFEILRRVQLVEAELSVEAEVLMRATAWRIEIAAVAMPEGAVAPLQPPPQPEDGGPASFFPTDQEHGYHSAMEVLFIAGGFMELGPATVWLRMRRPLVAGEDPSPLQRVLVAADVGNGVSGSALTR